MLFLFCFFSHQSYFLLLLYETALFKLSSQCFSNQSRSSNDFVGSCRETLFLYSKKQEPKCRLSTSAFNTKLKFYPPPFIYLFIYFIFYLFSCSYWERSVWLCLSSEGGNKWKSNNSNCGAPKLTSRDFLNFALLHNYGACQVTLDWKIIVWKDDYCSHFHARTVDLKIIFSTRERSHCKDFSGLAIL